MSLLDGDIDLRVKERKLSTYVGRRRLELVGAGVLGVVVDSVAHGRTSLSRDKRVG